MYINAKWNYFQSQCLYGQPLYKQIKYYICMATECLKYVYSLYYNSLYNVST